MAERAAAGRVGTGASGAAIADQCAAYSVCGVAELDVRPVPIARTRELRRAVLRPHETLEQVAARESPGTVAVGAFDDGKLVSAGMIAPDGEPGGWRIRGMATEPAARGRGAGSAVLAALLDYAERQHAARVWCNARTPARSLYERAGLRAASAEFELPEIGPHVVMALALRRPRPPA